MTTDLKNLCLVIHCIRDTIAPEPMAHKELFINLSDVDALVRSLKEDGYRFNLPGSATKEDGPVCSLTFDDGYFNNHHFLEVAEKYGIPFILFIASYNVIHRLPFIWDIWEATRTSKLSTSAADYRKLYESLNRNERDLLYNESHRPFTQEELSAFAAHPLVHLAPHGHTHQPMVGKYLKGMDAEIDNNLTFLAKYKGTLNDDFSLPCGLSTGRVKKRLLTRFQRIYTIDGGGFLPDDRVISRISLVNPDYGGPLKEQIRQSFGLKRRLVRKALNIRYSSSLFYRMGF